MTDPAFTALAVFGVFMGAAAVGLIVLAAFGWTLQMILDSVIWMFGGRGGKTDRAA